MIIWFDVYNHLKSNVVLEALDAQSLHQPQVIVGLQQQKKVNNPLKSSLKSLETI